jgi:glycosyltransferase involved in cell wall biosynthesis
VGGTSRVFLNLLAGLDRIGARYRINDYRRIRKSPNELACVIGKPHVLAKIPRETPILFGTAGYGHPVDDSAVVIRHNICAVLAPALWVKELYDAHWPGMTKVWPCGIDTDLWRPNADVSKDIDVLIYDKIRWRRDELMPPLLRELHAATNALGLRTETIRYGSYRETEFQRKVERSRAMVFLCEHESQGFALQQTLATDVPVLAWDRGGYWQDPNYYPHRVLGGPVTSVPYWDDRCGDKFIGSGDLKAEFDLFWRKVLDRCFRPRELIVETLTLEQRARAYLDIVDSIDKQQA